MQSFTFRSGTLSLSRSAVLVFQLALLLLGLVGGARAQAVLPAYYSTGAPGVAYQVTQPSPQVQGSGNVSAAAAAADGDFATFATLRVDATAKVGVPVGLLLKLTGTAPAGYRAGVVLANTATGLLNVSALGTVTLRTYLNGTAPAQRQETRVVQATLLRALLLDAKTRPTQLEFLTSKPFDAVEIEFSSVLGIDYTTDIYYAYGVRPGIQTRASGYLSRFSTLTGTEYEANTASGLLCVNTDVENPAFVADNSLTNFALLRSTASLVCNPALRAKLAGVPTAGAPSGYYAGFVIGQQSLLDASVLSSLQLTTYLGGVKQEERTDLGLLDLTLLPDNKAQVSFPTTKAFDEVRIQRVGLLTALDDLEVYYAFGLAPAAFEGINPVLSDFGTPQRGTHYFNSNPQTVGAGLSLLNGLVVVTTSVTLSSVTDPQKAADANMSNNDFAVLNTTGTNLLTVANTANAHLSLRLNGTGKAGNRVGMVVSNGTGLLDVDALRRLTVSTYDASNVLIESKSGDALLNVQLLDGSQRSQVSFLASRDFTYVRLDVTSAVSVSSNTRVYYAFAQDVPLLSLQAPLPVELTSFEAKWTGTATELRWATASEKNSSHFVVERSANGKSDYQALGRVAAAGSSSSPHSYQLRDADAGTLGVNTLYYRLRQVDVDGSEAFSPVVAVAVGSPASAARLDVYPNPAGTAQEARLDFRNLPGGGQLSTYAETGQLVSQILVAENAGRVALPALKAGLYYLVLRDAAGRKVATERLVVSGR